jgi:hypothetical protein
MQAIAFPFRFNRGRVVTLDTETDVYAAQKVLSVASTRNGELPLIPQFGMEDPEFDELDTGGIYLTTAVFFPEIRINEIEEGPLNPNGTTQVRIKFDVLREDPTYGYT